MLDTAREDEVPQLPQPVPQIQKTHSAIGIATCIAGVAMFGFFLVGILYFNLEDSSGSQEPSSASRELYLLQIAVVMFLPIPVHVIGLVSGLVSLFFPRREKLFPILGILLNLLFGICSLIPWVWLGLKSGGVR